jgi:hypothetical protein
LTTLRAELTPMAVNTQRVHQLSTFLMYANGEELMSIAGMYFRYDFHIIMAILGWNGSTPAARASLLSRLQIYLPPDVMLPPQRLQVVESVQKQFWNSYLVTTSTSSCIPTQSMHVA